MLHGYGRLRRTGCGRAFILHAHAAGRAARSRCRRNQQDGKACRYRDHRWDAEHHTSKPLRTAIGEKGIHCPTTDTPAGRAIKITIPINPASVIRLESQPWPDASSLNQGQSTRIGAGHCRHGNARQDASNHASRSIGNVQTAMRANALDRYSVSIGEIGSIDCSFRLGYDAFAEGNCLELGTRWRSLRGGESMPRLDRILAHIRRLSSMVARTRAEHAKINLDVTAGRESVSALRRSNTAGLGQEPAGPSSRRRSPSRSGSNTC